CEAFPPHLSRLGWRAGLGTVSAVGPRAGDVTNRRSAGCRGFTGPVPLPLWMSCVAVSTGAEPAAYSVVSRCPAHLSYRIRVRPRTTDGHLGRPVTPSDDQ